MAKIKICGMMREEDVSFCCGLGIDIVGFITEYPKAVPWNLTAFHAAKLLPIVSGKTKSCIVTGGRPDDIIALAKKLKPDIVQLHYKETLWETASISKVLKTIGIETFKAIPILPDGRCEMPEFESIEAAAESLSKTDISALIIDSRCAAAPNVSHGVLDFSLYTRTVSAASKPVIMAGGISAENINCILKELNPYGLDILSGVESSHGTKNHNEISRIFNSLKK